MQVCRLNLTIVVKTASNLITFDESTKSITGMVGERIDRLLGTNRKCKLVSVDEVGLENKEGNFSGALGLLQFKLADFILVTGSHHLVRGFFKQTQPSYLERVAVVHEIEIPSAEQKDILVQELTTNGAFDSICALEVFAFTLLMILINFLANQTKQPKHRLSLKSLLEILLGIKKTSFNRLSMVLLFFRFFLMLYGLLVGNSIQTKKTLIDQTRIITNPQQLFESNYEFCFLKDEDFFQILKSMPKNSVQKRMYERHQQGKCTIDLSNFSERTSLTKRVLFTNPAYVRSFLSIYVEENPVAIYWLSEPIFYDNYQVNYFRTGLRRSQVDAIEAYALTVAEYALTTFMFNLPILSLEGKFINLKIFTDLSEFIEKNTVFNSLTLNSLSGSFRALFVGELFILLLFLLHLLSSPGNGLPRKRSKPVKRRPRKPTY